MIGILTEPKHQYGKKRRRIMDVLLVNKGYLNLNLIEAIVPTLKEARMRFPHRSHFKMTIPD